MAKKRIEDNAYDLIMRYASDILAHPSFRNLARFKQHHNSNTYAHLIHVCVLAVKFARAWKWKVDEKVLVRSALLHDYYLYEWHDKPNRKKRHTHRHGVYAADNAERDFQTGPEERAAIVNHMWPVNPLHPPKTKEGWLVLFADKAASFREIFGKLNAEDHYQRKPKKE